VLTEFFENTYIKFEEKIGENKFKEMEYLNTGQSGGTSNAAVVFPAPL